MKPLSLLLAAALLSACTARGPDLCATHRAGDTESVIVLEHDPSRQRQVHWSSGAYVIVFDYGDALERLRAPRFAGDDADRQALLDALTAAGAVGDPLSLDEMVAGLPPTANSRYALRAAFLVAEVLESGRAGLVDTRQAVVIGSLKLVRFADHARRGRRFETRDGTLVLEIVDESAAGQGARCCRLPRLRTRVVAAALQPARGRERN